MTATLLEARRSADLYIATGTPVAASLVISICDQLDRANASIYALTLAIEAERGAANLYAKQVAHWIGKHDALLEQQLSTSVPPEWTDESVIKYCVSRGIIAAQAAPAAPSQYGSDELQALILAKMTAQEQK